MVKQRSKQEIAAMYAKALYDGANESSDLQQTLGNAKQFYELLQNKIEGISYLDSPVVQDKYKIAIIEEISKSLRFSHPFTNMLKLLAQNGHFEAIKNVLDEFFILYNREHNIAEVEVETLIPLSDKQDKQLKEKLTQIINKEVVIKYKINPEILGGLVIKSGTFLIDGSVKNKLESIKQSMKGIQ